jgi:hypothetical protein
MDYVYVSSFFTDFYKRRKRRLNEAVRNWVVEHGDIRCTEENGQ